MARLRLRGKPVMQIRNGVLVMLVSVVLASGRAVAQTAAAPDVLLATMQALDTAVFDAFNHCDAPGKLAEHGRYFASDVEFYHDTGGVTWTRAAMLKNTRQFVCGHFRRELIPGSLRVFPIRDFGALVQGTHQFCQFDSGRCDGLADFSILWRQQKGRWRITRVLSYGHRANEKTSH